MGTGLEKYELLAKLAGNEDPFFLRAVTRGKGTKENPTIINAMDNYRMVGCVCAEEDTNIKWTWLSEGVPKRCECGYWMELKTHPAPEKYHPLVICLERILDHLCFILIIIVNKM